jgi:fibronectin type 3 domain-containing protein
VFRIFNLGGTRAYVIQRNDDVVDTESTSPHGVFSEPIDAALGDRITLVPDLDLAPPLPPVFNSAVAQGSVCARLTWTASGDPTVVGYLVSFGVMSVELGQAKGYQYTVQTGPVTSYDVCALAGTTYYFAVQSINYAGQASAYSVERSVEMVTTAVLITHFEARAARDAVRLSWEIEADEAIMGYRVYRRSGNLERSLFDAPLSASVRSYVDADVRSGTTYSYVLSAIRDDGSEIRSAPVTATTPAFALALEPNAPNPFGAMTRIPFTLDAATHVTVRVYDVRGALVATLFDGTLSEGSHEVSWGGHGASGSRVASGTYFCTLTAGKHVQSRKMLLVR